MLSKKLLYRAYDEKETSYTWEYIRWGRAICLIDIDNHKIGCIVEEGEVKEETSGTQGDYYSSVIYKCMLYSKENLEVLGEIESKDKDALIRLVLQRESDANIADVQFYQDIKLGFEKIKIKNGDLVVTALEKVGC